MKHSFFLAMLLSFCLTGFAQKNAADSSGALADSILSKLDMSSMGPAMLRESSENACKCIAKIKVKNKSSEDISKEISKCVEKEVTSYELAVKLMESLKGGSKEIKIDVGAKEDHNNKYYFAIEGWLRDSCDALNYIIASDNKENELSMSKNKTALKYYKKGQAAMDGNAFEDAETYFRKAVEEDSTFVFAWDNLGISLRKNNKYPEAIAAYKKSISLDPLNATPLQNIPLVYSLLKQYDKSLEAYMVLIKTFPENPEGYYGAGQTYINGMNDFEKGLDYLCKAYNLYIKTGSPYRTDAENFISYVYGEMKKQNKEDVFKKILTDNHIKY